MNYSGDNRQSLNISGNMEDEQDAKLLSKNEKIEINKTNDSIANRSRRLSDNFDMNQGKVNPIAEIK